MATIRVLAGTNGAGKSSVAGARLRIAGATYFNPDEMSWNIRAANPALTSAEANSQAWLLGKRGLERAIAEDGNFTFETTLGGRTITARLQRAIAVGMKVRVWFIALANPDLHIARVRARVAAGGHDIPERDIRQRYDASRLHLIELMPGLASLRVFDNSVEATPAPKPRLLLHMEQRRIVTHCVLGTTPDWAKPILLQAFKLDGSAPR